MLQIHATISLNSYKFPFCLTLTFPLFVTWFCFSDWCASLRNCVTKANTCTPHISFFSLEYHFYRKILVYVNGGKAPFSLPYIRPKVVYKKSSLQFPNFHGRQHHRLNWIIFIAGNFVVNRNILQYCFILLLTNP